MTLLPVDPDSRRESEEYIRGVSGILSVGSVVLLLLLALTKPRGAPVYGVVYAIGSVWMAVGYWNCRRGYPVFSASWQLMSIMIFASTILTLSLYFPGASAATQTGGYVLTIVILTVYFTPLAGFVALLVTTSTYGLVLALEAADIIPLAPLAPEIKRRALSLPGASRSAFIIVGGINALTYVFSFYIARKLRWRREEAETARARVEEANAQLIALDQAKNRFLGVVSHDLRTPITSIKAYAEILNDDAGALSIDDQKKFSQIIINEGDRLHRLVTDLLDLDKMEAGKMEWNIAPQDVGPILANAIAVFQAAARDKNIALTDDIADALPAASVDADRIAQLVANLLSNALKFTPEGGAISVAATAVEFNGRPAIEIAVSDTGPGIPEEQLERIFDRFSQTETGRSAVGTGLGLAIAKEIATGHQGTIHVASHLGRGTTFAVTLPAAN